MPPDDSREDPTELPPPESPAPPPEPDLPPPDSPAAPGPGALVTALLALLLGITAYAHGFGLERGLDLADESAWLNSYTKPDGPPVSLTLAPRMLALTLGHGRGDRPL